MLSEDALALLDQRQRLLDACPDPRPEVTVTYFRQDARKAGGAYLTVTGKMRRIDGAAGMLVLEDGQQIPLGDICALDSPLLRGMGE